MEPCNLQLVDFMPSSLMGQLLLKCLLPLDKLAEQFGLASHHFSHVGRWWRWWLMATTRITKTTRSAAGPLNHLQCANCSLARDPQYLQGFVT
jgi:hypothetical protein